MKIMVLFKHTEKDGNILTVVRLSLCTAGFQNQQQYAVQSRVLQCVWHCMTQTL